MFYTSTCYLQVFSKQGTIFWEFTIPCILTLLVTGYFIFKYYRIGARYRQKFINQKRFIRDERERISEEIHDEIGSGLTALKLFTEMVSRTRSDVKEIEKIRTMVDEVSDKINEIIWSTNTSSDYLDNLIYYIEDRTRRLFDHTEITFQSILPDEIPNYQIKSQSRRECYLLIKEIVHNALKHAEASQVKLSILIDNDHLMVSVKDNGKGFDLEKIKGSGMGMRNIMARVKRLGGNLVIERYKGTLINIKIPLKKHLEIDSV